MASLVKILRDLSDFDDEAKQMLSLHSLNTELSLGQDDLRVSPYVPVLVNILQVSKHPELILLALRALTQCIDIDYQSAVIIIGKRGLQCICSRHLLKMQDLDIAEQCVKLLYAISLTHSKDIFRAGGLRAVLAYFDFFPKHLQHTAAATVSLLCKHSNHNCSQARENASRVLEALPALQAALSSKDKKVIKFMCVAYSNLINSYSSATSELEPSSGPGSKRARQWTPNRGKRPPRRRKYNDDENIQGTDSSDSSLGYVDWRQQVLCKIASKEAVNRLVEIVQTYSINSHVMDMLLQAIMHSVRASPEIIPSLVRGGILNVLCRIFDRQSNEEKEENSDSNKQRSALMSPLNQTPSRRLRTASVATTPGNESGAVEIGSLSGNSFERSELHLSTALHLTEALFPPPPGDEVFVNDELKEIDSMDFEAPGSPKSTHLANDDGVDRMCTSPAPTNSGSTTENKKREGEGGEGLMEQDQIWPCTMCTFHNPITATACEICGTVSPAIQAKAEASQGKTETLDDILRSSSSETKVVLVKDVFASNTDLYDECIQALLAPLLQLSESCSSIKNRLVSLSVLASLLCYAPPQVFCEIHAMYSLDAIYQAIYQAIHARSATVVGASLRVAMILLWRMPSSAVTPCKRSGVLSRARLLDSSQKAKLLCTKYDELCTPHLSKEAEEVSARLCSVANRLRAKENPKLAFRDLKTTIVECRVTSHELAESGVLETLIQVMRDESGHSISREKNETCKESEKEEAPVKFKENSTKEPRMKLAFTETFASEDDQGLRILLDRLHAIICAHEQMQILGDKEGHTKVAMDPKTVKQTDCSLEFILRPSKSAIELCKQKLPSLFGHKDENSLLTPENWQLMLVAEPLTPLNEVVSFCWGCLKKKVQARSISRHRQNTGLKKLRGKMAVAMKRGLVFPGSKVIRGPDWEYEDQDGGKGNKGTVVSVCPWDGDDASDKVAVKVKWNTVVDNECEDEPQIFTYRWGAEGAYDVCLVKENKKTSSSLGLLRPPKDWYLELGQGSLLDILTDSCTWANASVHQINKTSSTMSVDIEGGQRQHIPIFSKRIASVGTRTDAMPADHVDVQGPKIFASERLHFGSIALKNPSLFHGLMGGLNFSAGSVLDAAFASLSKSVGNIPSRNWTWYKAHVVCAMNPDQMLKTLPLVHVPETGKVAWINLNSGRLAPHGTFTISSDSESPTPPDNENGDNFMYPLVGSLPPMFADAENETPLELGQVVYSHLSLYGKSIWCKGRIKSFSADENLMESSYYDESNVGKLFNVEFTPNLLAEDLSQNLVLIGKSPGENEYVVDDHKTLESIATLVSKVGVGAVGETQEEPNYASELAKSRSDGSNSKLEEESSDRNEADDVKGIEKEKLERKGWEELGDPGTRTTSGKNIPDDAFFSMSHRRGLNDEEESKMSSFEGPGAMRLMQLLRVDDNNAGSGSGSGSGSNVDMPTRSMANSSSLDSILNSLRARGLNPRFSGDSEYRGNRSAAALARAIDTIVANRSAAGEPRRHSLGRSLREALKNQEGNRDEESGSENKNKFNPISISLHDQNAEFRRKISGEVTMYQIAHMLLQEGGLNSGAAAQSLGGSHSDNLQSVSGLNNFDFVVPFALFNFHSLERQGREKRLYIYHRQSILRL